MDTNNHAESSLQIALWLQHGFAWHAWNGRSTPCFHQEWHTFAVELGSQHLLPGSPCAAAVRALREQCLWKVWDPLVKSGGKGGLLLVASLSRHLMFQEKKSAQFCLQGTFWEMIVLPSCCCTNYAVLVAWRVCLKTRLAACKSGLQASLWTLKYDVSSVPYTLASIVTFQEPGLFCQGPVNILCWIPFESFPGSVPAQHPLWVAGDHQVPWRNRIQVSMSLHDEGLIEMPSWLLGAQKFVVDTVSASCLARKQCSRECYGNGSFALHSHGFADLQKQCSPNIWWPSSKPWTAITRQSRAIT